VPKDDLEHDEILTDSASGNVWDVDHGRVMCWIKVKWWVSRELGMEVMCFVRNGEGRVVQKKNVQNLWTQKA
jgi:hypothetical protein